MMKLFKKNKVLGKWVKFSEDTLKINSDMVHGEYCDLYLRKRQEIKNCNVLFSKPQIQIEKNKNGNVKKITIYDEVFESESYDTDDTDKPCYFNDPILIIKNIKNKKVEKDATYEESNCVIEIGKYYDNIGIEKRKKIQNELKEIEFEFKKYFKGEKLPSWCYD